MFLSCWMDYLCGENVFLVNFHPTQMVTNDQSSANLVCDFFCLWVTTAVVWGSFGHKFFGVCGRKPIFEPQTMQRKETYLTYQTPNIFRWWFAYRQRLNSRSVEKGESYPGLQLVILDFADISINFYHKEAIKFTATAPVLKWKVAQHIKAVRLWF